MTGGIGVGRLVADLSRAVRFYCDVLGFVEIPDGMKDTWARGQGGHAQARYHAKVLGLGAETIILRQPDMAPAPMPPDSHSNDLWFQHLALVVADIDAAYARLCAQGGWQAITQGGPQTLPPANGGVRAYKFRDPDGHPLELLWFPPGQGRAIWQGRPRARLFLGIDHTAIAVSDSVASVAFYQSLGLRLAQSSDNHGPAQAALDGVAAASLTVSSLRPMPDAGMGIELLAYHPPGRPGVAAGNTLAMDCIILPAPTRARRRAIIDPDGHRLAGPACRHSGRPHRTTPAGAAPPG